MTGVTHYENHLLKVPNYEWWFSLTKDSYIKISSLTPPNRFHRIMQRLLLGIIWGKQNENKADNS